MDDIHIIRDPFHVMSQPRASLICEDRAMGYNIQRRRIRESLNRVDPRNKALRWGALVSRRVYFVPWPNLLLHFGWPSLTDSLGI